MSFYREVLVGANTSSEKLTKWFCEEDKISFAKCALT